MCQRVREKTSAREVRTPHTRQRVCFLTHTFPRMHEAHALPPACTLPRARGCATRVPVRAIIPLLVADEGGRAR